MGNRIIIIFFFMALGGLSFGSDLNYTNRQLGKALLKNWDVDFSSLNEMPELSAQTINEGKIFKVENGGALLGYVYVGRIISCREGGCSKEKTKSFSGSFEYFDAFIIYGPNKTVKLVKVFNYAATHGHEVSSRGWLKQFVGFAAESPLEVGKSIDSISGATISVYALTDEVNYISGILREGARVPEMGIR